MSSSRCPILILGIGNILLGDEGVGVRVIEQMEGIVPPDDVELVDGGTGGADLLEIIAEREKVIVIDAVEADREPGDVLRLSVEDLFRPVQARMSLHEIGLAESLIMAKQLNCAPKEVVIFGVKPKSTECGLDLSKEVAACVPKVIELVFEEVNNAAR